MITLVHGYSPAVVKWVADRIDYVGDDGFGECQTIAAIEGAEIIAAVIYSEYRGHDVQMSIAASSPKWARRSIISVFFNYPFKQLCCSRVTAVCARNNKRARRMVEGFGFRQEGNMRHAIDGRRDAIIYGMLKNECRWLS